MASTPKILASVLITMVVIVVITVKLRWGLRRRAGEKETLQS